MIRQAAATASPGGGYGVPPGYGGYGQAPYGNQPSTYRAWAITCAICGVLFSLIIGLPCALVALANSRRVQSAWQVGTGSGRPRRHAGP